MIRFFFFVVCRFAHRGVSVPVPLFLLSQNVNKKQPSVVILNLFSELNSPCVWLIRRIVHSSYWHFFICWKNSSARVRTYRDATAGKYCLHMSNKKKQKSYMVFFYFLQTKGCNLFGLESCSSKWSADNPPEVSFKRVPLFNYFLRDLRRRCDNETVSSTCGSDPPQPDIAIPNSFIYWVISIHFDVTNSFDRLFCQCRALAASDVPAECDWIERLCHRSSRLISCKCGKNTGVKVRLLSPFRFVSFLTSCFLYES